MTHHFFNSKKSDGAEEAISGHKGRKVQGELSTPFEDVLRQADIITLHCPLNTQTPNTISFSEFAAMSKRPLLINTARRGLVDEAAVGPA